MKGLIRMRVGPFNIEDALTLTRLEEVFREGNGEKQLYPVDFALMSYSAIVINKTQKCSLHHGSAISLEAGGETEKADERQAVRSRAYTEDGEFVGMIKYDHETLQWRPEKIFLKNCCERVVEIDSTPISI
jgi:tRNA U55 pseudouridine synthase TruB